MEKNKNIPAEGEPVIPEAPMAESPVADAPAPDLNTGPAAPQEHDGITPAAPGDVVVSFDKIEELMAERRAAARAAVEQSEPPAPEAGAPAEGQTMAAPPEQAGEKAAGDKTKEAAAEEQKKPRRGRPPKEEKGEQAPAKSEKAQDAAKPRKGRPPKADKAAPGKAQPPKPRDKVGLLTKCVFIYCERKNGNKKDAHRRHPMYFIILFRFKAVAERRQWSSAASNPRRKTRVKLCPHFRAANVPSHQICRLRSASR